MCNNVYGLLKMKKLFNFIPASILLVVFIVWTILVKTIDVAFIDGVGYLGFSHFNFLVNNYIYQEFTRTEIADKISDVGLYLSFAVVAIFAVIGIVELVKRKTLKKVDPILYILLGTYIASVIAYVIFEIYKVNYSPTSTYGDLKASYPSSHVLFFSVFTITGILAMLEYMKPNKVLSIVSISVVSVLSIGYTVLRLFSGQHYFSDIIGSVFLSMFIIALFVAVKLEVMNKKLEEE